MNVRRMPSAPPNSPASNTTLSRGDAWPDWDASVVVQSSCSNTKPAKSTSWESSTSRSRVDRPGLNVVVHGSTSATSSSPRVIAWTSLACLPDDPRKMRGLFMRDSPVRSRDERPAYSTRSRRPRRLPAPLRCLDFGQARGVASWPYSGRLVRDGRRRAIRVGSGCAEWQCEGAASRGASGQRCRPCDGDRPNDRRASQGACRGNRGRYYGAAGGGATAVGGGGRG